MAIEANVPAVGLVIVDEGRVVSATAWGRTGNDAHPRADADTFFRVGSITKTFTALAMLELVADGKVSLDTPLDTVISKNIVSNAWHTTHPIRIGHLLALTAGLADLSWKGFDHSDPAPLTLEKALALEPLITQWPPGTAHSYTNAAAGLTSAAIERLAGRPFEDFVDERVLRPMQMQEASLLPTTAVQARLARGYASDGVTELPYWHMLFRGFGALNATPAQMGQFLEHMLIRVAANPHMLRAETTLAAKVGLTLGYGLGIYAAVRAGHVFYTHGGDADGYRSRYGLLPESGRAYFVIINADQPSTLERMRTAVEQHLIAGLPRAVPPPDAALPIADLDRFTGTYYPTVTRFRLADWQAGRLQSAKVTRSDTQMWFRRGDSSIRLIAIDSHRFRREADPVATLAFVEAGQQMHLQGELGAWTRRGLAGPRRDSP